jgi:hypothetical protein
MEIHLVDTVDLEKISMNKPKKNGLFMVSKPKYSDNELMIQMPKMNLSLESQEENTQVFLDFLNKKEYSKKVYDFLNTLDSKLILNIFKNSEEWFGKKIPMEKLTEMYSGTLINIFSDSNETERKETSTRIKVNINKKETSLIDKKNNELELSEYKNNSTVECICRLKYIIFSKDKCVPVWEIVVMKLIVKVNRVPKNAFIEDNSDNDSIEEYSFF